MLSARLIILWLVTQQQSWLVNGQSCDPEAPAGTTCSGVCLPTTGLCGSCDECPSGECMEGESVCADFPDSRIIEEQHKEETILGLVISGLGLCLAPIAAVAAVIGAIVGFGDGFGFGDDDDDRRTLIDSRREGSPKERE